MTAPDPTPGQVWEDGYGGSYAGRRVRIDRPFRDGDPSLSRFSWRCVVVAYPAHPAKVGTVTYLSNSTLRTKWRHVADAEQPDGWDDEVCDQPIRNGDGERCTLPAGHDEPCREDV